MEIFLSFLLIIVLVILIVLLTKQGNIQKEFSILNFNLNLISSKLSKLAETVVSKEDLEEVKWEIKDILDSYPVQNTASTQNVEDMESTLHPDIEEKEEVNTPSVIKEIDELLTSAIENADTEDIETPEYTQALNSSTTESTVVENITSDIEGIIVKPEDVEPVYEPAPRPAYTNRYSASDSNKPVEKSFFEKLFTENLLSKIGIVTLVLGIAFFVKYAIDQNWINEVGRVAIGILTGAVMIGIAHKLRKQYDIFSALLVGGGIAVFYFTITLAFREYELFSQPVAFALLIGITVLSVAFSLLYDRKELAIFSLLGGFASPLMISTGSGNYIVLFSFILILNTGMLVLAFRKNWHIIGTLSYILTLVFYMSWLAFSFKNQVVGGTVFAVLFFVQFYILALIDHFKAGQKLSVYHAILLLSNNLFLLTACLTIFHGRTPDLRGISVVAIALLNAIVMVVLYKKESIDRNLIYLLIAVVMSLITLAVPIQLNGNAITMFWAVEAVILLWLWQRSQIRAFSIGFVGLGVLVIISYFMDLIKYPLYDDCDGFYRQTIIFNTTFITGAVIVLSYLANIWLFRKEKPDTVFGISFLTFGLISKIFKVLFVLMTYLVVYIELDHQVAYYTNVEYFSSFSDMVMVAYTGLYVALLTFVVPRSVRTSSIVYGMLYAFVVIYSFTFIWSVAELRVDIFSLEAYSPIYFTVHLLALVALIVVLRFMIIHSKEHKMYKFTVFCWVMSVLSVIVLSVEAANLSEFMFGNPDNYYFVQEQVNTFVLPVLWGVIAMVLMVWGLKGREVVLRKISLVFFAIIIVKFYAYDVWRMSQAGRIVSFVLLGVILLVVSFLQQKIKILVKSDSDKIEDKAGNENMDTN